MIASRAKQTLLLTAFASLFLASTFATAQNSSTEAPETEKGVSYGEKDSTKWRVGVKVTASKGPMQSVLATVPVPIQWPEQHVKVLNRDVSRGVRVGQRKLGGVQQLLIRMPSIPNGRTAHAMFTMEITRRAIVAPEDTSIYQIPKKIPRDVKRWLGKSPYIDFRHAKFAALAKEATADADTAWEKVEAIYDLVRKKIEYREGKIKSALQALNDGVGDCEELTSVFIALCRSIKVPARMVWVPDHCYPEFYLVDDDGEGHWFPCQAAGTRAFGSMPEMRPILQKGDNFKVPEKRTQQRYVAEHVEAKPVRGSGKPRVTFVREYVQPGS